MEGIAFTCHQCGRVNRLEPDADPKEYNCGHCNKSLVAESLNPVYCLTCDTQWQEETPGWVQCPQCGYEFEVDEDGDWISDDTGNEPEPSGSSQRPTFSDFFEESEPTPTPQFKPLFEVAHGELYRVNAFRLFGLQVEATDREIARQSSFRIKQEKIGEIGPNRAPLPLEPPPDLDTLREAEQRLRDPERRLVDEFFWFWPLQAGQSHTDYPLLVLSQGDCKRAALLWRESESRESDSEAATHNLAVLSHAIALDLEHLALSRLLLDEANRQRDLHWREAYKRWKLLLECEGFWSRLTSRIRQIDDPSLTTGAARRLRNSLPLALIYINIRLAVRAAEQKDLTNARRHLRIASESGFDSRIIGEALRMAIEPIGEKIKTFCKNAKSEAEEAPARADDIAIKLLDQTAVPLGTIDCILPAAYPLRDYLHDEIALSVRRCLLNFGNATEEWDKCLTISEEILEIAVGDDARRRIEEDIASLPKLIQNKKLETHIGPIYTRIDKILESKISSQEKLRKLREEIKPQLDKLKARPGIDVDILLTGSNILASAFRSVAIDLNNEEEDFEAAYEAIQLAQKLCCDFELKKQIEKDLAIVEGHYEHSIYRRFQLVENLVPVKRAPALRTINGIGTKLYGHAHYEKRTNSYLTTLYFVLLFIPIFALGRYRVIASSGNSYQFLGKVPFRLLDKWHNGAMGVLCFFLVIIPLSVYEMSNPRSSINKDHREKPYQSSYPSTQPSEKPRYIRPLTAPNGEPWPKAAGYVKGFKKLHTNGLSTVTIDNSQNNSDVFIKLISLDGAKPYPVRMFFIPAYSQFTLNKIRAGQYDIRYQDLDSGSLSRSEPFDLEETPTYDGVQYSTMTMTLYKVRHGNMQTYPISESDF